MESWAGGNGMPSLPEMSGGDDGFPMLSGIDGDEEDDVFSAEPGFPGM
jgi:hypothetical protein